MEEDQKEVKSFFKQELSWKYHVCTMIVGLLAFVASIWFYVDAYEGFCKSIQGTITTDALRYGTMIVLCVLGFFIGGILMLTNLSKDWFCFFGVVTVVILLLLVLFHPYFRTGAVFLALTFAAYLLMKSFIYEVATVFTFFVGLFLVLVLCLFLGGIWGNPNCYVASIYALMSLYLVFYLTFGTKATRFAIEWMGEKEISKDFTEKHFKNNIYFIYLLVFVLINVFYYLNMLDDFSWGFINNLFLTGIAILQVNWELILSKFSKKVSNKNEAEHRESSTNEDN